MEKQPLSTKVRAGTVFFALLVSSIFFYLYLSVAHLGGVSFLKAAVQLSLVCGLAVYFFPGLRFFLYGLYILMGPRALSFLLGRQSHDLLFPGFAGFVLGLLALHMVQSWIKQPPASTYSPRDHSRRIAVFLFSPFAVSVWTFGLLILAVLRAIFDFYDPLQTGLPLLDRPYQNGVSANYSLYLTLMVVVHVAGPVLLILAEQIPGPARRGNPLDLILDPSRGIALGLILATLINLGVLVLQWMGIDGLWLNTGLSRAANRPPGLFTDSGQSTILLPLLISFSFLILFSSAKHRMLRWTLLAVFPVVLLLTGLTQGRAYWLSLTGVFVWLVLSAGWKKAGMVAGMGGFLFLLLLVHGIPGGANRDIHRIRASLPRLIQALPEGPIPSVRAVDPPRASLLQANLILIKRHPWTGTGLNTFMVHTPGLNNQIPDLPADNPPTLFTGIILDGGLIGLVLLFPVAGGFGFFLWKTLRKPVPPESLNLPLTTRLLATLPLALLPSMLVGYHLVSPEFAPLLLLPFLLRDSNTLVRSGID